MSGGENKYRKIVKLFSEIMKEIFFTKFSSEEFEMFPHRNKVLKVNSLKINLISG